MMRTRLLRREAVELAIAVRSGAPTLLLLHGLAGYGREWTSFVERLDAGLGIVAPDLRGHGDSTRDPGDLSRAAFVDDAVMAVERFTEPPVVVVGHSMGGIVGTLLAAARPDLVAGLMVVEAGMGMLDAQQLADSRRALSAWPVPFSDEAAALDFFGATAASTAAWVDGLDQTHDGLRPRFEVDVLIAAMENLARSDRWHEWEQLSIPVLLCRAEQSWIEQSEVDRMSERRPSLSVIEIASAGHDVHLDQPDRLARAVSQFVSEIFGPDTR